jgi:hypothetical protein
VRNKIPGPSHNDSYSDLHSDEEDDVEDDVDSDEEVRRKAAMDALVAPLEPGEYGTMPAEYRHANSQATAVDAEDIIDIGHNREPSEVKDNARPVRKPVFQRDKFDGVDSDDETSEEEVGGPLMDDDEDEDDRPQIVGEIEIDMEQEQEDFLKFSREALGIDDETWASIIADREKRGGESASNVKSFHLVTNLWPFL